MNSILLYNLCEKYDKEVLMKKERYVGICTVGEKGQIVIPKAAREMFNIKPGDSIITVCDKNKGIVLIKSDILENNIGTLMSNIGNSQKKQQVDRLGDE